MAGRLQGKVALVSGAARGQGRSHAVRMAQEGADIIAFDICGQLDTVAYPLGTHDDLQETARLVEQHDRRIVALQADVRDGAAVQKVVAEGVAQFGRLDIVCANAGILTWHDNAWSMPEDAWDEMIAVNLTGVWKTVRAAIPVMIEADNGGAIVITGSTAGLKGSPRLAHYTAAKHGLVGLAKTLAMELAPYSIRVNTVHPTGANTQMVVDATTGKFYPGTTELPDSATGQPSSGGKGNLLPVYLIEPDDVSCAVIYLASDEGRYVTGAALPVDAGLTTR